MFGFMTKSSLKYSSIFATDVKKTDDIFETKIIGSIRINSQLAIYHEICIFICLKGN